MTQNIQPRTALVAFLNADDVANLSDKADVRIQENGDVRGKKVSFLRKLFNVRAGSKETRLESRRVLWNKIHSVRDPKLEAIAHKVLVSSCKKF